MLVFKSKPMVMRDKVHLIRYISKISSKQISNIFDAAVTSRSNNVFITYSHNKSEVAKVCYCQQSVALHLQYYCYKKFLSQKRVFLIFFYSLSVV